MPTNDEPNITSCSALPAQRSEWRMPDDVARLPMIMGILNVTPDSFSDGGKFIAEDSALRQVEAMISQGADIIDIGGESTRPGALEVSTDEELLRVIPVIEKVRASFDVPISIDTSKPTVMKEAVGVGASLINDVNALEAAGAIEAAAKLKVPVCVMHRQGTAKNMQDKPDYEDVVMQVAQYLQQRVEACVEHGIERSQIIVDPGFGFGKTLEHNLLLMKQLPLVAGVQPVLVGVSRKSMIGDLLNRSVDERLPGGLALASLATWLRAAIIRVHDVKETVDAVSMIRAVRNVGYTAA